MTERIRFTGYGRGWSEERAATWFGRMLQKMREPATTSTYLWVVAVLWAAALGSWALAIAKGVE